MCTFSKLAVLSLSVCFINLGAEAAILDRTDLPAGEIVRAGICVQPTVTERYSQPQSTAGYATNGALQIIQETDVVPLRKGIGFGFDWRAKNMPPETEVIYRVEHPKITRPDGVTLERFEEPLPARSVEGKIESTDCYMLSEDHELVSGQWTISIFHNGHQLVRRTFHVQPAQ